MYGRQQISGSYFGKELLHIKDTSNLQFNPYTVIERQGKEELASHRFLKIHMLYAAGGAFEFKNVKIKVSVACYDPADTKEQVLNKLVPFYEKPLIISGPNAERGYRKLFVGEMVEVPAYLLETAGQFAAFKIELLNDVETAEQRIKDVYLEGFTIVKCENGDLG